jgi:hypothetical protein
MASNKHANDEYVNPSSATAGPPVPPEIFPSALEEEKAEAKDKAEELSEPRDPAERRQQQRAKASAWPPGEDERPAEQAGRSVARVAHHARVSRPSVSPMRT